jgi:hypothetical protein
MKQEEQEIQEIILQKVDDKHLSLQPSIQLFIEALAAYIHQLINHDFSRLVQLLYRMDISEKKLKQTLATSQSDAGLLIANMMIERELQKIQSRKQFKNHSDIPEDEKW